MTRVLVLSDVVFLTLAATVGAVRLWVQLPYVVDPLFYPDSPAYVEAIELSTLFAPGRAPLLPILHGLLGRDAQTTAIAQLGLSIISWSLLAWSAHRYVGSGIRGVIAGALLLLLGASARVSQWDHLILSESMSLSFLALVLAAALSYDRRGRNMDIALFLMICACWVLVRESNYLGVGLLGVALFARRIRDRWATSGLALAVIAGLVAFTGWRIEESGRWRTPFYNVIGHRVLPDDAAVKFMQDRGMPISSALVSMSGKSAWDDDRLFHRSPALAEWRAWTGSEGRQSYALLLLARPLTTLQPLFSDFDGIFAPNLISYASAGLTASGARLHRPYRPPAGLWVHEALDWQMVPAFGLVLFAVAMGYSLLPASRLRMPSFAALLVVTSVPFGLILWHSDASEISRHSLPAAVIQNVGLILFFAGARLAPWEPPPSVGRRRGSPGECHPQSPAPSPHS